MLNKLLSRLALCLALAAPSAWAAGSPPVSLRISQARLTPPEMVAYIDVRDAQGRAVPDLSPYQLNAQIDGAPVEVKGVKPFSENEEGTAYIFLVDVSRSLRAEQFDQIRAALSNWIASMTPRDWAALLSFGDEVRLLTADFSQDKALLTGILAGLGPTDGNTRLHDGLLRALDMGRRMDANLPRRTAMVVLSDGMDDVPGSITGEETLARLREEHLPLYAIGWASPPMNPAKREGLKHLGILARSSGGAYLAGEGRAPAQLFQDLRRMIREVQVARLDASAHPADNRKRNLNILLKDATRVLPDQIQVRMTAPITQGGSNGDAEEEPPEAVFVETVMKIHEQAEAAEKAAREAQEALDRGDAQAAREAAGRAEQAAKAAEEALRTLEETAGRLLAQAGSAQDREIIEMGVREAKEAAQKAREHADKAKAAADRAAQAQKRKKLLLFGGLGALALLALGVIVYLLRSRRNDRVIVDDIVDPVWGTGDTTQPPVDPYEPPDDTGFGPPGDGATVGPTIPFGEDPFGPTGNGLVGFGQHGDGPTVGPTDTFPPGISDTYPPPGTPEPSTGPGLVLDIFTVAGRQRNRVWHVECRRETVIGRAQGCEVAIDDPEASSRHCRLFPDRGRLFAEDLGSTNGTLLNGVPFKGVRVVESGDVLTMGRTQLRINHRRI